MYFLLTSTLTHSNLRTNADRKGWQVWGKKFNGLNVAEPWVILVVSIVVLIFTAKCVVLKGPPISSSPGGAKLEEKED